VNLQRGNRGFLLAEAGVLAALLIAWTALSRGLTVPDWSGLLLAMAPLALAAMTQTLPVLAGGQGLAAGALVLLIDVLLGAAPIATPGDALLWIALGLLIGAAIGFGNGLLIGFLRLPSTAVTYATGIITGALAFALAQDGGATQPPEALTERLFGAQIFGLPILPIALMLAVAVAGILFQRSSIARALREIGEGTKRAHSAAPLRCMAYTIAGLGYGATGILLAGQIGAADSMLGMPVLLQIFASVALAGSCPGLRSGSIPGALLGAAIVAAAANLLIPLGIPDILSPSVDAFWLLLGIAGCALLRDRPPRLIEFIAPNARPAIVVASIGILAVIALTLWRPEAAGIATIAAGLALLVVGQGAVMRLGGFDLAMPAMIAVGGMATVSISQGTLGGFAFALLLLCAMAILLGAWHAFLAPRLGRAIILATLASAGVLQAIAAGFMVWSPTGFAPPHLTALSARIWLGLPLPVWIFLPGALVLAVLLDRCREKTSAAYITSALSAALFGSLLACVGGGFRLGLVDVTLVPVVAGAVLGGIDFVGGRGSLLAAIGAVLILQVVDTLLVGLGISYEARLATMGLLILLRTGLALARRPLPRRDQG